MVNNSYCLYYCRNATTVCPIASHDNASMSKMCQETIKYIKRERCKTHFEMRDGTFSKADNIYMNKQDVNIQFGAQRNHWLNAAEKSIATFKRVFIAEVESLDAEKFAYFRIFSKYAKGMSCKDMFELIRDQPGPAAAAVQHWEIVLAVCTKAKGIVRRGKRSKTKKKRGKNKNPPQKALYPPCVVSSGRTCQTC